MSTTSKSPRRVAQVAMEVARRHLPAYSHRNSRKTYTQWQLFACLVLKDFFAVGYRDIEAYLRDLPGLRRELELKDGRVPVFSTLQKAAGRLFRFKNVRGYLLATMKMVRGKGATIRRAAGDSTGFESGHISPYFVKRRARGQKGLKNPLYQTMKYTRFPKLALICDCDTHLILCAWPTRGPTPDVHQLKPLLNQLPDAWSIQRLYLDAGYDSHANHVELREERKMRSYIPSDIGRPTTKPPTSPYRRLMKQLLSTSASRKRVQYGQRWQSETVNSMMKRNQDHAIHARKYWTQCREMLLRVVTHNIMICA